MRTAIALVSFDLDFVLGLGLAQQAQKCSKRWKFVLTYIGLSLRWS